MPPSATAATTDSGDIIVKRNPATLELVGEVPCVDITFVPIAVRKARQAQKVWADISLDARRDRLKQLQVWVAEHQLEIARTVCEETGKPRLEATNVDIMSSLSVGRFAIGQMGTLFRPKRLNLGRLDLVMRAMGRGSYLHARPLGVVGRDHTLELPVRPSLFPDHHGLGRGQLGHNQAILRGTHEREVGGEGLSDLRPP